MARRTRKPTNPSVASLVRMCLNNDVRLIVKLEAVAQKRRVAMPSRLVDNWASRRELATSDNIRRSCKRWRTHVSHI